MTQLLADLEDIQKHLPNHKVDVGDSDTSDWQIEANRIVKSKLSGVFSPVTLHSWNSPANTPALIRSVAGELIAAYLYRSLYSEDEASVPEYAQTLYNEAIALLDGIREGSVVVLDDNDEPIVTMSGGLIPDATWSYPDGSAPGPYFKMADTWA